MVNVVQIPLLIDNYSYIISDDSFKVTACIDPRNSDEVLRPNKQNQVNFIFKAGDGLHSITKVQYKQNSISNFIEIEENNISITGNSVLISNIIPTNTSEKLEESFSPILISALFSPG